MSEMPIYPANSPKTTPLPPVEQKIAQTLDAQLQNHFQPVFPGLYVRNEQSVSSELLRMFGQFKETTPA